MVDRLVHSEANARRIAQVETCFGSSGQPLTGPGRVLVGEGVLTKLCRKKPKPRQFFLFNDILVYGNIVINKKKYNKQHIIPLENIKLQSLEDNGELRNGWLIISPTKSFAVYAATATEKSEWMAHINKCIQDLLAKGDKRPMQEHAAVWVPDSEANICQHCNRTKFTPIQRRHHCRNCGRVVCGACSSKKYLLPHMSSKPLRVCLTCFDNLSKGRMQPENAGKQPPMPVMLNDDSSDDSDDDSGTDNTDGDRPSFYDGSQPR
ncbi:pleckstrin homology domain-containing family F member 2-like isoform X5 [Branchiostoma lanceolatum]|uniref:PLEKHF2 protein n=1 Tax=Branchiostoma lanceolatum TaxID=7740 RepID=A0A8K0EF92_BRALA|nr:PLEKHF2 [Branchiostoma lanceolatum]